MLTQKEFAKIYDTVLQSPGMDEMVKLDLRMKRRDILLLSQIAETGIASQDTGALFSRETIEGVKSAVNEMMEKGKLIEFNERLKQLANM